MTQMCEVCGGGPARFATFRGVIVILIGVSVQTRSGFFCRDCATAVFRDRQKFSLVAGWWGIPALAAPIALFLNSSQMDQFRFLPAPEAGHRHRPPLPPGRPVTRSPALAVPIVLGLLVLAACGGVQLI